MLKITPENNATAPKPGAVTIKFDEVVSETPKGARDLAELVFISPKSGRTRVDWDRTSIQIRPAKGWKSNTVYTVQLKAGMLDLYNNPIDTAVRVVFSTGGPIPESRIKGVLFDWLEARGMNAGVVEAVSQDTTIVFQVVSDSIGRFEFKNLPDGPYLLRGYADKNNNKDLDPLEVWDTVRVTLTSYAEAEFYAFQHDTVGLRIATIEPTDSNRVLKVTFDKPYSPYSYLPPEAVRLVRLPDSVNVPARTLQTAAQKAVTDSLAQKRKADSVAAANAKQDTLSLDERARRDSIARVKAADSLLAIAARREREAREAARKAGRRYVPPDTTPPPAMKKPKIYKEIFITLDSALSPGAYRLQINGATSLNATTKSPSRNFTIAKPKVDSSKKAPAKADSVKPPLRAPAPAPTPARPDSSRRQ